MGLASGRAVLKGGRKRVRNAGRSEPSQGRSLLHGQDMGKTQDHRSIIEQLLAVGSGWWLVAVSGWRLAVGGPGGLSLMAVLRKKNFLKDSPWGRGGGGLLLLVTQSARRQQSCNSPPKQYSGTASAAVICDVGFR